MGYNEVFKRIAKGKINSPINTGDYFPNDVWIIQKIPDEQSYKPQTSAINLKLKWNGRNKDWTSSV